jgi:uncharacterized SAM-binding protein YcdF (DUF218 family)
MDQTQIDNLANKIWDYMLMHHKLEKADCILVLGSHDVRVAERGAQLFIKGFAPFILFSGARGNFTQTWEETEAERFSKRAIEIGVPKDKILIEDKSTNTGQNITLSKELLEQAGINVKSIIAVQKPHMERRTFATIRKFWPDLGVLVTSPQIPFEAYSTASRFKDKIINDMVGDLQRIKLYPAMSFQIPQEIPVDVWDAYKQLVAAGYTKHLVQ